MPKLCADRVIIFSVIGLVAWAIIGLPILYWPTEIIHKPATHAEQPTHRAETEPRGTASAPFFVQVIPSPKTAEESAQEAEDREEKKSADRWLVRWTAALFGATVGLILATGVLGFFGWRQARDMKASIGVAERAARSSERAAKIAEDSLIKLERPLVYPTDWAIDWFWHIDDETRHSWGIRPIYHNSGNSPTVELTTNLNFELRDTPLPENFSFLLANETFSALIAPKANVSGGRVTISDRDLHAVQAGTKHFYIWGLLRYHDVFDGTPEHVTTFCRYITTVIGNPLQRPSDVNPVRFFFAMHVTHNSAD